MLSVTSSSEAGYPPQTGSFSPAHPYPEYPFGSADGVDGGVYAQVRETFKQAGLDRERFGSPAWNPLGQWIKPGHKVFLLCNFVQEKRLAQSRAAFDAKCTHGSVLRALCDYVLIALQGKGRVCFGNAPIQIADWSALMRETGAGAVEEFYARHAQTVRAVDLRTFMHRRSVLGNIIESKAFDSAQLCKDINFTSHSLLSAVSGREANMAVRFRVTDYDPAATERLQCSTRHAYLVHREILESDVVISVPKLKTHEKVGITCGLKGFVGVVGHKDCLAHHRFGSAREGGDEYPRGGRLRLWQSRFHDFLNSAARPSPWKPAGMVLDRNLNRVLSRFGAIYGGSWNGNDTCWRMALDLARIVHYTSADGHLQSTLARQNLLLIDGIVAGEGQGPLSPSPARAGTLVFSDNVALGDLAACRLMGYDPRLIPIVREALNPELEFPLVTADFKEQKVTMNGAETSFEAIHPVLGRPFNPPHGWRGALY